ncbi:GNAT family N-acetyltransferase [Parasphingopyxis marina]|uniref:GNAT family N-acetyltransferase n=1 Tax=Parasphingopyxis marina TaxID=2761622 RepID=A0A842HZW4_9SPHN|nr:GNAT family N-acetyltransferase [Parasphingopyxis marina]MBC2777931.1 GNAT family N-acetyltransferase [Parasphingopyxis marina]
MSVEVKIFDQLADVAEDAGDALSRGQQPILYDRMRWFEMTQKHCGNGRTPLVVRAMQGDSAAWMFLCRTGKRSAEALTSWYTLAFDIVRRGEDRGLIEAIAGDLGDLARISLAPMASPARIVEGFTAAGWKAFVEGSTQNWQLRVPDSFDAYWAARPGKLRSTVKRKAKKANLEIRIHRAFDEDAWADYQAIYAESWKPEEGSWDFMRDFVTEEGEAGSLRLGIAYQEGRPVAAQLWHVENGHATIHKLAYAESAKSHSPGSILGEAMFRHVIEEDRPATIDYGTGNEPYKADWMDAPRPLYRIELFNPRQPAAWAPLLKRKLSALVRRSATD